MTGYYVQLKAVTGKRGATTTEKWAVDADSLEEARSKVLKESSLSNLDGTPPDVAICVSVKSHPRRIAIG